MKYGNPNLNKIPSELLEPWLKEYLMMKLESLLHNLISIEQFKSDLLEVDSFITFAGGIHSSITTTNIFYGLCSKSDEEIFEIVNKTFKK